MAKQLDRAEYEGTIELELSPERMPALSRADAAIRSNQLPVLSTAKSLANAPKDQRGGWAAVILRILAASVMSGGIAYLATIPAQPVRVGTNTVGTNTVGTNTVGTNTIVPPAAPEASAPPSADNAPVRFANPFDATEVFEFPSGTSETEARQAVADLLLQRARGRQNSSSEITHQRKRTAGQVAPVTATSLAQRSD